MKLNTLLLASCFTALLILPACNWFSSTQNEPEAIAIEEIVIMEPELETLQDQQVEDEEINDLNLLNEK